jgi:lauroyl/myristoyl acyltransferase
MDYFHPWAQWAMRALPPKIPFRWARPFLARILTSDDPHQAWLRVMEAEVLWLNRRHLRKDFMHAGIEGIDPARAHVFTTLHFGHWGMYPASLYVQYGISSQMVASGRNIDRSTPRGHFWYEYGHRRMDLSGFPACYSTEGIFRHLERLRRGINLTVVMDVREHGLAQAEARLDFLDGPLYVQRSAALLARRAGVPIVPYLGWYDAAARCHRVRWLPPMAVRRRPEDTLQEILDLFGPTFAAHPEQYFNDLPYHRQPLGG